MCDRTRTGARAVGATLLLLLAGCGDDTGSSTSSDTSDLGSADAAVVSDAASGDVGPRDVMPDVTVDLAADDGASPTDTQPELPDGADIPPPPDGDDTLDTDDADDAADLPDAGDAADGEDAPLDAQDSDGEDFDTAQDTGADADADVASDVEDGSDVNDAFMDTTADVGEVLDAVADADPDSVQDADVAPDVPEPPTCLDYCQAMQAGCQGEHDPYAGDFPTCMAICTVAGWAPGTADDVSENTLGCRVARARLALGLEAPAAHCPAASPHGGDVCGSWCDNYCHYADGFCAAAALFDGGGCAAACAEYREDGTFGDQTGDTVQCRLTTAFSAALQPEQCPDAGPDSVACADGPSCAAYCELVMDACGADLPFASVSACGTWCAFDAHMPLGEAGDDGVNTVACRMGFAALAQDDPEVCGAAGPSGGGVCGTWCDTYCQVAPLACPGLYEDSGACALACAAFPDGGLIGALAGDSVQCRMTRLAMAFADDSHCPAAGPTGDDVCTAPALTGDVCEGPAVAAGLGTIQGDTLGMGDQYGAEGCASAEAGPGSPDVVVAFTPSTTGLHSLTLTGAPTLLSIATDCGDLAGSGCFGGRDYAAQPGPWTVELSAGVLYLLIVDGAAGAGAGSHAGPFELTLCMPQCDGLSCGDDGCGGSCGQCASGQACDGGGQCVPAADVVGETCANPFVFDTAPATSGPQSTASTSDDHALSGGCAGDGLAAGAGAGVSDLVWSFTPTETGAYPVRLVPGADAPGPRALFVTTDCDDMPTGCVGAEDFSGGEPVFVALTAGLTHFFIVDSFASDQVGAFELELGARCEPQCDGAACGPDSCGGSCGVCDDLVASHCDLAAQCVDPDGVLGNTCGNPFVVGPLPYATPATTLGASDVYSLATGECDIAADRGAGVPDHAYRFIAPATTDYVVRVTPEERDVTLAVFDNPTCDASLLCLAGSDSGGEGAEEAVTFAGTAGATYFIVVDGAAVTDAAATYELSVAYAPPTCARYCARITDHCAGANAQYADTAACEAYCGVSAGWGPGMFGDTSGDSVGCRLTAAEAAGSDATACPAAGPSGGGVCGEWCEVYCNLTQRSCVDDDSVHADDIACAAACAGFPSDGEPSATDGDSVQCRITQAGLAGADVAGGSAATYCPAAATDGGEVCVEVLEPTCANYCATVMAACTGELAQYASLPACLDYCTIASFMPAGTPGDTAGNSIACRLTWSLEAATDPTASCGATSPSGGDVCGSWCVNYCHLSALNCFGDLKLYASAQACQDACALFPSDAAPGATSGDSVQCRLTQLGLAGEDLFGGSPQAYCPEGAASGGSTCVDEVVIIGPLINEVDYDQPGSDAAEYIELVNPHAGPLTLADFVLELVNQDAQVYATYALGDAGSTLPAGGYLLIGQTDPGNGALFMPLAAAENQIQNGTDDGMRVVFLGDGTVIDSLGYEGDGAGLAETAPAPADVTTAGLQGSLARCPDGHDSDDNSIDFVFTESLTPGEANGCGAQPPSWATDVWPLMQMWCGGCHVPNGSDGGLTLGPDAAAAWNAIVDVPAAGAACVDKGTLVVPFDAAASIFYQKVIATSSADVCGGPMPTQNPPALPEAMRDLIRDWIDLGAEP